MWHTIFEFFHGLKPHDFVTWWKAISIAVTGGFGILGLTTEFRHKRGLRKGQITGWGWTSLFGIILSSLLGVAAQLIESSKNAQAAVKNSQDTLALAQKADVTLHNVERLLSPLGDPTIFIGLYFDCTKSPTDQVCKKLAPSPSERSMPREDWQNYLEQLVKERMHLLIEVSSKQSARDFAAGKQPASHPVWAISDNRSPKEFDQFYVKPLSQGVEVDAIFQSVPPRIRTSEILSVLDISKAVVSWLGDDSLQFHVVSLSFITRNEQAAQTTNCKPVVPDSGGPDDHPVECSFHD